MNAPSHCASCRRPLGARVYVTQGYLGAYHECEWCINGTERPVEPELITDTFTNGLRSLGSPQRTLDAILDKLTGDRRG